MPTPKKKVPCTSLREANRKIQKLEQKNAKSREALKKVRAEKRSLKKRLTVMTKSRDNWKAKNREKRLENKCLKEKIKREEKAKHHRYSLWLVSLCVRLRVCCGCSYRCICRILLILDLSFDLSIERHACANTIQNWVSKTGLHRLENYENELYDKKVCFIIDESIRLGNEKLLLILACRADKENEEALNYQDVEVCYMKGSESWTGEAIKEAIEEVLLEKDYELDYIISDEATNLKKAVRLLEVQHVPDLSHAMGTCLRRTFEKEELYKLFIKQIGAYQSKGVNRSYSYVCPPKQRSKARFMNQKKIIKWAVSTLGKFDQLSDEAGNFFSQLTDHKEIIAILDACIILAEQIALPLKKLGLSKERIQTALDVLDEAEKEAIGLLVVFIQHLRGYLKQYQEYILKRGGNCQICSDVIESMFGTYKSKVSENPLMGVTLLSLELPALCMKPTELSENIRAALEEVSILDLQTWRTEHSVKNQVVKRRDFHKK